MCENFIGLLPLAIDVVIQKWTFSRLRESAAAHVVQRELSPMSRLRRNVEIIYNIEVRAISCEGS